MRANEVGDALDVEHVHTFGVDDLFFSTTDRRGVIESTNAVFECVSGYSHGELIGKPHNKVRHPAMPGGAFTLVWDEIRSGRPVCAYIQNLAKDGTSYWVLSTMLPVGEHYLSVRLRPCVPELLDYSGALYATAAEHEHRLRQTGWSRAKAAEEGAALICAELAKLGITGMPALTAALLPAEMSVRSRLTGGVPDRPDARGPLAELLAAVRRLSGATDAHVAALEVHARLAYTVSSSADSTRAMLDQLLALCPDADEAARSVGDRAPVLVNTAKGLTQMAERARGAIAAATDALDSVSERITRTRTLIALGRLHIDMVGHFTAELIDGDEPPGAEEAIVVLCEALSAGNTQMAHDIQALPPLLHEVAELTRAAAEAIGTFRRWAIRFRNLITRELLWNELGHITPPIDDLLARAFEPLRELEQTAGACVQAAVPFDPDTIHRELVVIRGAVHDHFAEHVPSVSSLADGLRSLLA